MGSVASLMVSEQNDFTTVVDQQHPHYASFFAMYLNDFSVPPCSLPVLAE